MLTEKQLKTKKRQRKIKKMEDNPGRISRELRDIIHGYVMSDGYITKYGSLQVEQAKKQEKFVEWLYEKLKTLCAVKNKGPAPVERGDKRTGTKTYSARFYTRNILCGFKSMWYKEDTDADGKTVRRKSLPKSIDCFFNSTFVTLWFAGDGTKNTDFRGAKFDVTAFTPEERSRLKELFKRKFDIDAKINRSGISKKGKEQWVLQIPAGEYDKFREVITRIDLITDLFPNKLHDKK